MSFRICKTCNVLKPLDQEHFDFQKKGPVFEPGVSGTEEHPAKGALR